MTDKIEGAAQDAVITIYLEQTGEGQYGSSHEIKGVDPVTAAWILIDVGRDLLLAALAKARSDSAEKGQHDGH